MILLNFWVVKRKGKEKGPKNWTSLRTIMIVSQCKLKFNYMHVYSTHHIWPRINSAKEGPMGPFLTAARWIPLAIDPFITLHDVFLVGIQGRSGQRETMNKWVNICGVVSICWLSKGTSNTNASYLSKWSPLSLILYLFYQDFTKTPRRLRISSRRWVTPRVKGYIYSTYSRYNQMNKPLSTVRCSDANSFKNKLSIYICPDDASRSSFIIPDMSNKAMWGWNNTITARFLCPMRLIAKFDENPE